MRKMVVMLLSILEPTRPTRFFQIWATWDLFLDFRLDKCQLFINKVEVDNFLSISANDLRAIFASSFLLWPTCIITMFLHHQYDDTCEAYDTCHQQSVGPITPKWWFIMVKSVVDCGSIQEIHGSHGASHLWIWPLKGWILEFSRSLGEGFFSQPSTTWFI